LNALVLSGGGARGAYQVGVLRRVAEMRPDLPFPILAGSSAGSVNVSYLAGRADGFAKAVDSLARLWADLTVDRIYRTGALSVSRMGLRWLRDLTGGGRATGIRARSLLDTTPLAQLLDEHVAFRSIQPLIERGVLHAVSVTATSYTTGQSVSFVQGGPTVLPWGRTRRIALLTSLERAHVLASCAIPFLFPAVRIGDAHYGDGNVRLGNPFSPPARLGASRIFAVSTRHPATAAEAGAPVVTGYPPLAQVAGVPLELDLPRQLRRRRRPAPAGQLPARALRPDREHRERHGIPAAHRAARDRPVAGSGPPGKPVPAPFPARRALVAAGSGCRGDRQRRIS
jgi:NTE family protein